jgi:hypothetical protein
MILYLMINTNIPVVLEIFVRERGSGWYDSRRRKRRRRRRRRTEGRHIEGLAGGLAGGLADTKCSGGRRMHRVG